MIVLDLIGSGIRTAMDSLLIDIDGQADIPLGIKMPEQIETIYGISVQVDGVGPSNQLLPTMDEVSDLYLTLIQGANRFWNNVRLSDLVFMPDPNAPGMAITDQKFMMVNIDAQSITLDQSFLKNPSLIATAPTLIINLWYIMKTK